VDRFNQDWTGRWRRRRDSFFVIKSLIISIFRTGTGYLCPHLCPQFLTGFSGLNFDGKKRSLMRDNLFETPFSERRMSALRPNARTRFAGLALSITVAHSLKL